MCDMRWLERTVPVSRRFARIGSGVVFMPSDYLPVIRSSSTSRRSRNGRSLRLHLLEQGHPSALAHRLDHQTIAVTVHDPLIARRFGLYGATDRPAATISD